MNHSIDVPAYLTNSYFHEDCDLESPTPSAVVEKFARLEGEATTRGLFNCLLALVNDSLTEDEAKRIWLDQGGAYYDPAAHGVATLNGSRR
ncbi:contact-dependent growth inhibition system immunity protein [Amycolatopsis acidiphila]|uniref:contact-dependent growth inhibition system immunity protein n=1 Tax=Amycolatopsis acidiphila TaxID=715473 RepID=UPI001643BB0D